MTAFIQLKNGRFIDISNFKHIAYQNGTGGTVTVKEFENFYLYNRLLNFIGEKTIVTINSTEIEYVRFDN